ncbi:hypothetical protein ACIOFQ_19555 [[Kitasatospora] papulosa]
MRTRREAICPGTNSELNNVTRDSDKMTKDGTAGELMAVVARVEFR